MTFPAILFMIIGILCVLYGIAVFLIRSGTMFYAVWLALGTCFLLMSFLIRIRFFDKLPKIARALLLIAAAAVIVLFLICEGFVLRGFGSRAPEGLDYLIVLGAQVREDGPSAVLKYRLDAAVDYLRENESTLCIVTGGKGEGEPLTEGEGMKQYLTAQGIDPARILVEDQARNTVQNIQFSKQLMTSPGAPQTGPYQRICDCSAVRPRLPPQQHVPGVLRADQGFPGRQPVTFRLPPALRPQQSQSRALTIPLSQPAP